MDSIEYKIQLTPLALEMLVAVQDRREQEKLRDRIEQLKIDPEKQGKALLGALAGLRSIRAVGQRYRIIYQVQSAQIVVLVVGIGRRKEGDKKDIYSLTEKLLDES
ncbi:type II toxin-antitoxin system RelE family toxin [Alkalinema pantanalense CENA528]|uniref:type II toxin-antitoxin system RelE family toxin n=1 Tax=Alkalinema pantanalense TaxID=1620705 RepID=UPI003D6FB3B3